MFLILAIIVCLLAVLYKYLNSAYDYWKNKSVPFHPPVTFFGNVGDSITVKRSLGQIYSDIYNSYKNLPYVGIYKMRQPCLLIRDPEIVKDVLIKDFHHFERNDLFVDEKVDPIASKNPFLLFGPRWKLTRSQLSYCFTSGKMKYLFPFVSEVSNNMVKYIEKEISIGSNPMDTKELAGKFTSDNVATCAFGVEGNSFVDLNSEFRTIAGQAFHPSFLLTLKLMIIFMFPTFAKFLKVRFITEYVANYFGSIIKRTLKYRKENGIVRNDFLDVVTQIKLKPGIPILSEEEVIAHAISFFGDGFETSSITISFALYDLASNEDIQNKLRNEIEEVLKKHDGFFSYDALQEMTYLDCILSESMRLHPAALDLAKICTKEYNLPPCKDCPQGVTIEENTPIVISIYALHHDAKYFKDPERFDPERFSESNKFNIIKGTYLPFGEGPRICIGMKFAVLQVKIAIVAIIRNFEIRVNKKTKEPLEIDPTHFLNLAKGGLWLDYHKLDH